MMRTRSNPLRMLDNLPPELLSQVLAHLKPQEMLVFSTSSRRWCGTDYDVLYWKPAFLNAFALDPQESARRPTRGARRGACGGTDTSGRGGSDWNRASAR